MRINVKVIPNAGKTEITPGDIWKIKLSAPAREGKANQCLIELLAEHFKVAKSDIRIIRGEKSRHKVIEILK